MSSIGDLVRGWPCAKPVLYHCAPLYFQLSAFLTGFCGSHTLLTAHASPILKAENERVNHLDTRPNPKPSLQSRVCTPCHTSCKGSPTHSSRELLSFVCKLKSTKTIQFKKKSNLSYGIIKSEGFTCHFLTLQLKLGRKWFI